MRPTWRILTADVREGLASLPDESVHCVVTSPPYWGLRDYGVAGQLGLEETPEEFVAVMVDVFREVRRVLRKDGVLWLNMGDSYAGSWGAQSRPQTTLHEGLSARQIEQHPKRTGTGSKSRTPDLKPKDLVGVPWRLARALQEPYYTGRIRNEVDRVWLAAMLDAEGCLFIHRRKAGQSNGQGYCRKNDSFGPGVEISNTSEAVVERIMQLVGQGSICSQGPDENARRRQRIYRWNLRTTECREFVTELYPHLVAKKQQARILIGCPSSGDRAASAHAALIALHRTGRSDVDFPEPPSMFEPGWWLRSDCIWAKANPMPESITDRPTKSHEYVFLLTKSERYAYDADAVRVPHARLWDETNGGTWSHPVPTEDHGKTGYAHSGGYPMPNPAGRNLRTVWTIATQPYAGAHFATFPQDLARICILAGTSEAGCCGKCGAPRERVTERVGGPPRGNHRNNHDVDTGKSAHATGTVAGVALSRIYAEHGYAENRTIGWKPTCECAGGTGTHHEPYAAVPCVVLDPFAGSGTTGAVAIAHGRSFLGVELSPAYVALARKRIGAVAPLLAKEVAC